MREIGVRELKATLSETLRAVGRGELVRVTLRGRPLADIVSRGRGDRRRRAACARRGGSRRSSGTSASRAPSPARRGHGQRVGARARPSGTPSAEPLPRCQRARQALRRGSGHRCRRRGDAARRRLVRLSRGIRRDGPRESDWQRRRSRDPTPSSRRMAGVRHRRDRPAARRSTPPALAPPAQPPKPRCVASRRGADPPAGSISCSRHGTDASTPTAQAEGLTVLPDALA